MMLQVYCYFDKKMSYYSLPIFKTEKKEEFTETFLRVLSSGKAELPVEMLDCDLYYLGVFDDKSGRFGLLEHPEFLLTLSEYYKAPEKEEKDGEDK